MSTALTSLPGVTLPIELLPRPISDSLSQLLDQAAALVPPDKRGKVTASASTKGAEVSLGWKISPQWMLGAWGATTWEGQREAGVRLTATW